MLAPLLLKHNTNVTTHFVHFIFDSCQKIGKNIDTQKENGLICVLLRFQYIIKRILGSISCGDKHFRPWTKVRTRAKANYPTMKSYVCVKGKWINPRVVTLSVYHNEQTWSYFKLEHTFPLKYLQVCLLWFTESVQHED